MIRLSQCMIVKNEEKNIRRALSWGKGIVQEQIVVDTGSSDRTVEIPWNEDFSAAKNYAIDQAKGTWIAFLDADEYFKEEDVKKLSACLKKLSPEKTDGIMTSWVQLDSHDAVISNGTQVRLFPNRRDLRYRRRIHEQLVRADGKTLQISDATENLAVFHTGYAEVDDLQERKCERNIQLIQRELEDHPDDYEMLGYLGDVYYSSGKLDEAELAYRKAVERIPETLQSGDQRSAYTFLNLIRIWDRKEVPEEKILSLYQQALSRDELGMDADFDYVVAQWYLKRNRRREALTYLLQSLRKLEQYGIFGRAMQASAELEEIYGQTAACYHAVGNFQEAVRFATTVLQTDLWSMKALCVLMESFRDGGVSADQADQFLERLYDKNSLKSRIFLLRSAGKAVWPELEQQIRDSLSQEEQDCFERSLRQKTIE